MKQVYKKISNTLANKFETPRYIILFLNDKCWMKCSHCWYNSEWKEKNITGKNLSFDELEKLSKSIDSIPFLSMTGGEAILRDDIVEIADMFVKNSGVKRYDIPTSGWDTDLIVQRAERILQNNPSVPFRMEVSIDGIGEVHDEVRNREGAFKNACETLWSLNILKKRYSSFNIGIITTISNKNQHQVDEIAAFIKNKLPLAEWMVNATRDTPDDKDSKAFSIEAYKKVCDYHSDYLNSSEYAQANSSNPHLKVIAAKNIVRAKTITQILEGNGKWGLCSAGNTMGVIFNDGLVKPCETSDLEFGNLRDYDFNLKKLWKSENAQRIRNQIIDDKCFCTHECFLSLSLLMRPKSILQIVKERAFL